MMAAVSIQDKLRDLNAKIPDGRQPNFRIRVNAGDVIEDRGDIYGNGVNVAACIEALATPGGICISDSVRSAVRGKLSLTYVDLGEQCCHIALLCVYYKALLTEFTNRVIHSY